MGKIELIEKAKFYSEQLKLGVEPISGIKISDNNPYNTEKMRKYFDFVSDILGEVLVNNGTVELKDKEEFTLKKGPFNAKGINKKDVFVSKKLVKPVVFVSRINYLVDNEKMEKFLVSTLNCWLVENGYLKKLSHKSGFEVSKKGLEIGIIQKEFIDKKNGNVKKVIFFKKEAQEFLLNNIENIK